MKTYVLLLIAAFLAATLLLSGLFLTAPAGEFTAPAESEPLEPIPSEPAAPPSPACPDGTLYEECSKTLPLYCNEGILENNCELCGCFGVQQVCNPSGRCSIFSHIKLVGNLYGEDLDPETLEFAANHFDAFNNFPEADLGALKQMTHAPVLIHDNYHAITYPTNPNQFTDSKYGRMQGYATENNLDFEDFFLHYAYDTLADLSDQCNEINNPECPSCELNGVCNLACSKDVEGIDRGWHNNWNNKPDTDCSGTEYPLVKGWNPVDDVDNDGVRDVDPPSDSSRTAYYRYESRVPSQWFGKYMLNVGNPEYKKFNAEYVSYITDNYDGIIIDNSAPGFSEISNAEIVEYPSGPRKSLNFRLDLAAVLAYVKSAISYKLQLPNVATYYIPEFTSVSDGHVQERSIQYSRITGVYLIFFDITKQLSEEGKIEWKSGGSPYLEPTNRDMIFSLATYYLGKTDYTYYSYLGSYSDPEKQWFGAIAYDIGSPTSDYHLFASGSDPSGTSGDIDYQIYARNYTNTLILVKFKPWFTSSYGDNTSTTHPLPGDYYLLDADGTPGEKTSTITLRNAEGVILIPA